MLDFPNSPAIGDTYAVDNTIYRWDGQKWRFARYAPPYKMVAEAGLIGMSGAKFDAANRDLMRNYADTFNAPMGSGVQSMKFTDSVAPVGLGISAPANAPKLINYLGRNYLDWDGVDDQLLGRDVLLWSSVVQEVYMCFHIIPRQVAAPYRFLNADRPGNYSWADFWVNPDGTLTAKFPGPPASADVTSVSTKLIWDQPQTVEMQYGWNTDQMVGFAIDGGAVEKIASGRAAKPAGGAPIKGVGLRMFGKLAMLIFSGKIPDPETRTAYIELCKGAN